MNVNIRGRHGKVSIQLMLEYISTRMSCKLAQSSGTLMTGIGGWGTIAGLIGPGITRPAAIGGSTSWLISTLCCWIIDKAGACRIGSIFWIKGAFPMTAATMSWFPWKWTVMK